MTLYKSLLFLHGHVADAGLAGALSDAAGEAAPPAAKAAARRRAERPRRPGPGFLASFWYLGGLDDLDPRIDETGRAYGQARGRAAAAPGPGRSSLAPRPQAGCAACA